jgi:hypothetical protein
VTVAAREVEVTAREQRVVEREDGQLQWEVARENEFARRVKEREATWAKQKAEREAVWAKQVEEEKAGRAARELEVAKQAAWDQYERDVGAAKFKRSFGNVDLNAR